MVNPERRYTHGGILAALVDLGADWAMVRKTRPRRADHRHARRLSRRRAAGRSHHQGQGRAHGRPVLDRRGASSTRRASCSPAAAAPISRAPPRPNRRRAVMSDFHQPRRSDPPRPRSDQDRDHRSRRRGGAARVQLCAARRHDDGRRARARQARASSAASASRSFRPIAPNISRPISASCARASSRCR